MLLDALSELVSPTRCAGCELPGTLLCPRCAASLPRIAADSACPACGAPAGDGRCSECEGRAFAFASARCFGTLGPPVSRMIVLHKDGGERRLGPLLGALLAEALPRRGGADAVAFVPASRKAIRRRGFDHAEAIAGEVADALALPLCRALSRVSAGDQRVLGREARASAVSGAFAAAGPLAAHILLVDDVLTTGATVDAAARELLRAGAERVDIAAVARACGGRAC